MKRINHEVVNGVETKRCYICKQQYPLSEFNANNRTWDGLEQLCRTCQAQVRSTPRRAALNAYRLLLDRVNNRGGRFPRYQEKGIVCRVSKEDFIAWYEPRYFKGCLVDRIDDDGHYELGNMQLIGREDHNYKARQDNLAKRGVIEADGTRYCYGCETVKSVKEFGAKPRKVSKINPLGLDEHCRECRRKQRNAYYRRTR